MGRLLSQKTINYKAITVVLHNSWNLGSNICIKALDRNMVSCTFLRSEDMDKIENSGPWAVKGALLNLQMWSPELNLKEVSFSHCNFWIQVHNLPPNRRNKENLCKIGNYIGKLIRCDDQKALQNFQKFIRILVSVNIQTALKLGCIISRENGEKLWVAFKY